MALDKCALEKDILAAFDVPEGKKYLEPEDTAKALAEVIYNFVRSGEVTEIVSKFNGTFTGTTSDGKELTGTVKGEVKQGEPVKIT